MNAVMDRLDNLINPIVVKELRQAVAGKFVSGVLMLFLVVQLVVIGFALFAYDVEQGGSGRGVFLTLLGIMLATCLLFIPAYAATRLIAERTGTQQDLLYITTIRPGQVVFGKFLSALVVTVLIYSACIPFLALTYLLRGIDLPTIFLLLFIDFLVVAEGTMFAIFLACIPASRSLKSLLGLAGLGTLFFMFSICMGMSIDLVQHGSSTFGGNEWVMLLAAVVSMLSGIGLMHVLSVALISPPSSNRALPVRIYVTVVWLLMGALIALWSWADRSHAPMMAWSINVGLTLLIALLVSVSERHELGGRVRRTIPRNPLLRSVAFFFYSGAAGGVAWTLGLFTLSAIFAWNWYLYFPSGFSDTREFKEVLTHCTPFAMYIAAYTLTAAWIRRVLLSWIVDPPYTWALALILIACGIIGPFLLAIIMHGYDWHDEMSDTHGFFATVPFIVFVWQKAPDQLIWYWTSGVWLAVAVLFNVPWLFSRYMAFKPDVVATGRKELMTADVAEEATGDDGVEHPDDMRFWMHGTADGMRLFGVADDVVFWAGVPHEDWNRLNVHLEAGRLPVYLVRDFGRLVPVASLTRVKSAVHDTAVDIDFADGGRTSYTRIRTRDAGDRDAFMERLGEATGNSPATRDISMLAALIKPGVVFAVAALFTWACYAVVSDLEARPASVVHAQARGFKALILKLVPWFGSTGLLVVCGVLLFGTIGWLAWSATKRPKVMIIEKPASALA